MARMLPPYISDAVKSTGERQIFDLFKTDPDTADWVILHSLGLTQHIKRLYGEIDFLVLAPKLGIFCLEVKSGNIVREEGIWKFTNRFGETTSSSRSPFQQAQEGMFSLIAAVKKTFGEYSHQSRLLYGFGVMFPHVFFQIEGTEIESWQIYDRDARRLPISSYIKRLSQYTQKKVANSKWFNEIESIPSQSDIEKLVLYLRGDFEKLIAPKHLISDVEKQIYQFTEEQYICLDELQDNPRCLFQGPAGTGKTMIALESVRRSLLNGERVLLTCFNTLLGNWMASQFQQYELENRLTVGNFHRILTKISCHSNSFPTSDYDKDEFFTKELPLTALEAIDRGSIENFNKIIIDEGQDLIRSEYLDVFDALLEGGLAGGNWEIYSDFERQAIYSQYSRNEMLEMLESRGSFTMFRLTVNCRNTKPIHEEMRLLSGFEAQTLLTETIPGIPVEYYFYSDLNEEVQIVENILCKLRKQDIQPNYITILSPYRFNKSCVARLDQRIAEIVNLADSSHFPDSRYITYSTIHGFKGLENSYIILVDIDRINDDQFRSMLYIGMSRAKVGLIILLNEQVKKDYNKLLKSHLKRSMS